ncbi:MAG: RNA polymerase subunit sigma-70 [Acidobacteria bacterium]|nr:MAG: RNA polymerase subunit sigma-70 [Acidobacteriota bacterium]REK05844.1 MAG: RNA polymerase subunit sigma-70 [Acidobacteriota bacterium]
MTSEVGPSRGERTAAPSQIERLLAAARDGEAQALDGLVPLLYERLHLLARRQLRRLRPGQTLQTTGLVHEAYLKLVDQRRTDWQDRNHFLCVAAVAMRQILVDHARRRSARKRGGRDEPLSLDGSVLEKAGSSSGGERATRRAVEILDLDRALGALERVDPRLSRLVEMRFFAGMTIDECAATLQLSERTIQRDWRKARALLHRELAAR